MNKATVLSSINNGTILFQGNKKPAQVLKPLEIRRVLGWFIVLGLGLIIALFITICEVYCKKPKKQRTPEEIAARQAAREAKKNRSKGKKDKAEEVETQQLTAHEAPIGNSQMEDAARLGMGMANAADDATLKKRGTHRKHNMNRKYNALRPFRMFHIISITTENNYHIYRCITFDLFSSQYLVILFRIAARN